MICPQCQTDNRADAKFCNECGYDLRTCEDEVAQSKPLATPEEPKEIAKTADEIPETTDETPAAADETAVIPTAAPATEVLPIQSDTVYAEAQAMFGPRVVADAEVTADLTGLERLVDSSYVPPAVSGRAGDTIQLPRIDEDITPRSQSFRASVDRKELKRQQKEQRKLEREQKKRERELRRQGAVPMDVAAAQAQDDDERAEDVRVDNASVSTASHSTQMPTIDDTPRSSRKGPMIGLVVLVVLVIAIVVGATYYFEMWGGKSIPDVAGESLADARSILEEQGFATVIEQVKSDDVEGLVIDTDPPSGARAEEGTIITLFVATSRTVPDVAGKTQAEIEQLMDDEGFTNVTYTLAKSNEPEGTGIGVEPASGERAKSDDAIVVTLAQSYTVPDVAGKTTEEATRLLEGEGYVVTTEQYNTEDYREGTAVSTDPAAGAKHPTGSAVTLYVAHNRSTELIDLTRSFFNSSSLMTIGGVAYRLDATSLQLTYAGDNTVNFTVSGTEVGFIFGIAVDNPSGPQTLSGSVAWDDDNNIVSTYPVMRQGA